MTSNTSPKDALQDAFNKAVTAILPDMAVLMHGSGDAISGAPATQELIARLTVEYMGKLVDAAIDAYDMVADPRHKERLPPPPLNGKKRPRPEACWDDPLPTPKIKRQRKPTEWMGLSGVDLFHEGSARATYVHKGSSMAAPQFMFALCHDTYVYGRIRQVQAMWRSISGIVLQDSTIADMVGTEGAALLELKSSKRKKAITQQKKKSINTKEGDGSDGEDEDEGEPEDKETLEEQGGPSWPGLESLLPAYRDFKSYD